MLEKLVQSITPQVLVVVVAALLAIGIALFFLIRALRNPKDKEKRRRLAVNQFGRLGDATVTDIENGTIFYEYSVRGVGYMASQDISQLGDRIPTETHRLIGPATLKYTPVNPANSIVVCEEWSGLRVATPNEQRATK